MENLRSDQAPAHGPTAPAAPAVTWPLVIGVLDVLEAHGYHKSDDEHTGRAVGLVGKLARVYAGGDE